MGPRCSRPARGVPAGRSCLVNTHGPGGARHSSAADGLLLLACDLTDPSVRFDESWWDPIGMRGTVSYLVRFDQTFIPEENQIGQPGQYLQRGLAGAVQPPLRRNFSGRGGGRLRIRTRLHSRPRTRRVIPTCSTGSRPWHSTWRVPTSGYAESPTCGRQAARPRRDRRATARVTCSKQWATDTVQQALHACGARGLIRPSPLERIYRDLSFYVLHDNSDQVLATIGREILGQAHDASFFNPPPDPTRGDATNHESGD